MLSQLNRVAGRQAPHPRDGRGNLQSQVRVLVGVGVGVGIGVEISGRVG